MKGAKGVKGRAPGFMNHPDGVDVVVEEGLRLALRARSRKRVAAFVVQPFQGDGLAPEFAGAGWDKVRDEIYRDRG